MLSSSAAPEDDFADVQASILARPTVAARQGKLLDLTLEAIVAQRIPEAMQTLMQLFGKALKNQDDTPSHTETRVLLQAADMFVLLAYLHESAPTMKMDEGLVRWLFGSEARVRQFLDMVTPEDRWPEIVRIVSELRRHDPKGCDRYRRLVMALAFVWDQPRPPLHEQMGGKQLKYEERIADRFDYFRTLFDAKRAVIPYRRLSTVALTYVVDLPLPDSELAWIRKKVRPRNWKRKFFEVSYDRGRIERGVYQWPHGPYTLESIKKLGGICVDQAYYATMCARAYGVPALMFAGEGRRGPHAWYGYMKGADSWEMDIGRYAYDKYATGVATNPQTNRPMTDHDVEFLCDRALRGETYSNAARYGRLAFVLKQLGYREAARQVARRGVEISPLYVVPWKLLAAMLREDKNWTGLARLLGRQAEVFRKYPDSVARIRAEQADALRRAGDQSGAERVLTQSVRRVDSDRDDLERSLVSEQIRAAYEAGKTSEARKMMEDLLHDQKKEGRKVTRLLQEYLDFTSKTKQTKEATRFLKRYIPSLQRQFGGDRNRALLLDFLVKAYENDGDKRQADRVRKKIERLQ